MRIFANLIYKQMNIKSFVIISLSMFFAMTACNSQVENQNQKENVTECKPVVSTVRFDTMTAKTLPNFKGGDGEVYMKMFTDGEVRAMYCTMPPGASVGCHSHETNMETVYVLAGNATIFFDGNEQVYTPGTLHYCPKGHSHSIHNFGDEDLVTFNVVALPE